MKKSNETTTLLSPNHEAIKINGKLFYSEGDQSWNIIRLKKDVLKEFPQLKEKRGSFSYKMVIHRSPEEIKKSISEVGKDGAIPILLFFCKEKSNSD